MSSFKDAQSLKLVADNPMQAVKIPVHRRERGKALTAAEVSEFLAAIKGKPLEDYFLFLLYTGCRRNEGLSLCAADVDFKNKLLHIRGTKTEKSDRIIPFFENVAALLVKKTPKNSGKKTAANFLSFAPTTRHTRSKNIALRISCMTCAIRSPQGV